MQIFGAVVIRGKYTNTQISEGRLSLPLQTGDYFRWKSHSLLLFLLFSELNFDNIRNSYKLAIFLYSLHV